MQANLRGRLHAMGGPSPLAAPCRPLPAPFPDRRYVYFDYNIVHDDMQTGWCYRRKENFTFR